MTERQAWLKLADEIKKETKTFGLRIGLCTALTMYVYHRVRPGVVSRMHLRIREAVKRNGRRDAYGWPRNHAGYAARVRFCKRQVARIDRARRKR